MVAVTDTSVLINFYVLDLFPQLSILFNKILVPSPVRDQFLNPAREDAKSREVVFTTLSEQTGMFAPCNDYDTNEVTLLQNEGLDPGESEALSQFKIVEADILLIDEVAARKIANLQGLRCRGTARILAELEKLGMANTWECIRRLRSENNFRVSNAIVQQALWEAFQDK